MEALFRLMFAAIISLAFCASTFAQETVEYIHTDALGSPVAITDQAGNVIGRATYQPFGETVEKIQDDMLGMLATYPIRSLASATCSSVTTTRRLVGSYRQTL